MSSEFNTLSDLEYAGLEYRATSRSNGQALPGGTLNISTTTASATVSSVALDAGYYRLVALTAPVHVRLTDFTTPVAATTNDMVVPVGVPIVVRLGKSSITSTVTYNQLTTRTTAGTGNLYVTQLFT